ncbi:23S rRNA (pseudouridine(1915)-N(3))-methyltransferase RlmH [Candidatus Methylocalor cossyra]|uniref:Ribosomal RNA large subunit methyltransferase H n=1 Tax=Candidatus Methylocalor cossyra TaxID=3108543 RepID=A0ABM9NH47_9GAMM
MRIQLIAVGDRMPGWVAQGYHAYAKRLPRECQLVLREIAPAKRGKNPDLVRLKEEEGARILAALSRDDRVVALEVGGAPWSTPELARRLAGWLQSGRPVALLVGGPDGLSEACRQRAEERWSLSRLTLPHALVRIVVAEQIYRAWSMLQNHPYHR